MYPRGDYSLRVKQFVSATPADLLVTNMAAEPLTHIWFPLSVVSFTPEENSHSPSPDVNWP